MNTEKFNLLMTAAYYAAVVVFFGFIAIDIFSIYAARSSAIHLNFPDGAEVVCKAVN
ncbi:MAG: hypothetical protein ABJN40_13300 [Sneathiella sp.]